MELSGSHPDDRLNVAELRALGWSTRAIAETSGWSVLTVRKRLEEFTQVHRRLSGQRLNAPAQLPRLARAWRVACFQALHRSQSLLEPGQARQQLREQLGEDGVLRACALHVPHAALPHIPMTRGGPLQTWTHLVRPLMADSIRYDTPEQQRHDWPMLTSRQWVNLRHRVNRRAASDPHH